MVSPTRPSTVKDIAAALGVSVMTVSRALNGHPAVAEQTRRLVLQKAAELNYRPNRLARSLVTSRSWMIGLIVPDISHTYYSEITRGAQEVLREAGYHLLLCMSNRDARTEIEEINVLLSTRCEGLLVVSEQRESSAAMFAEIRRQRVPVVLIDRFFETLDCSYATTDDHRVGYLAAQHMIGLGHRRIAFLRGPDVSAARLRLKGFLAALADHGIPLPEEYLEQGQFRFAESHAATLRLLALAAPPTAIVAANDISAFGAIRACRDAGFEVPVQVSVMGAGNVEGDQHPNPFLTTIAWDRLELGREAARLLLAHLASPDQPQLIRRFPPELLVRHSTSPPARREPPPKSETSRSAATTKLERSVNTG
ncbi:MAG: LacI family transcriptional regulator [Bryobacteraceae bacterium]|nr:LacI family transcriptional regulator [Bryobacteraceae bacterium]MDW8377686.1 LacI family DNA-binding transcriptional regulator [Bryobacterales bacterium]